MASEQEAYGWHVRNQHEAREREAARGRESQRGREEEARLRALEEERREERRREREAMLAAMSPEERERFLREEGQAERTHCNKIWICSAAAAAALMLYKGWSTPLMLNQILGAGLLLVAAGLMVYGNRNPDARDRRCLSLKCCPVALLGIGLLVLGGILFPHGFAPAAPQD